MDTILTLLKNPANWDKIPTFSKIQIGGSLEKEQARTLSHLISWIKRLAGVAVAEVPVTPEVFSIQSGDT